MTASMAGQSAFERRLFRRDPSKPKGRLSAKFSVRLAALREGRRPRLPSSQVVEKDDLPLYARGMLRQPLELELAAASRAAATAGLGTVTPELLHLGNHTSARLAPWPLVARIASGPSFDYSDGSIGRELWPLCLRPLTVLNVAD